MRTRPLHQLLVLSLVAVLAGCSASGDPDSTMDTGDGGTGRNDASSAEGDAGGSARRDASSSNTDEDAGEPDEQDEYPADITAHVDETCNVDVFAGFQITIGMSGASCTTRWDSEEDRIQITVGEIKGRPPENRRTYDIIAMLSGGDLYPSDGEATGVYIAESSDRVESGTLTIEPDQSDEYVGTYDLTTAGGETLTGTFRTDICAPRPGDCE